jgi:hypothetical protein
VWRRARSNCRRSQRRFETLGGSAVHSIA